MCSNSEIPESQKYLVPVTIPLRLCMIIDDVKRILTPFPMSLVKLVTKRNMQDGYTVHVAPSCEECCPFSLHFHNLVSAECGFGTIGIEAGRGAYINIPEDVSPYPASIEDIPDIVLCCVRAIIEGHLEETIHYTRKQPYRWDFTIDVSCKVRGVVRSSLWGSLCSLLYSKTIRKFTYRSYYEMPFDGDDLRG